jgi:4-carboxymuconolactone decarboxylase
MSLSQDGVPSSTSAKIISTEDVAGSESDRSKTTVGGLSVHRIAPSLGTDEVQVNVIVFEPGARFLPHVHPYDQVLHYVSGTGIVALDGGEDQIVEEGQFVLLPAGIVQMHGAAPGSATVHVSTMRTGEPGVESTDFDCEIPESWQRFRS